MARVKLLNEDGSVKMTKDKRAQYMYSVDGRVLVDKGELIEVREIQQIGDKKKHVLVAYRPVTEADKKKKIAAKKAKIAALQAELAKDEPSGDENKGTEKQESPVADVPVQKPKEDTKKEEKASEEPKKDAEPAKKAGRTRPPRTKK